MLEERNGEQKKEKESMTKYTDIPKEKTTENKRIRQRLKGIIS